MSPPSTPTTERRPFDVDHVRAVCPDAILPPCIDPADLAWGWRLNKVDHRSTHGYRWPWPGNWAEASGPILDHAGECCEAVGDGICAAFTIDGAQSAGARFAHHVGLLVAWTSADVLGASTHKVRLRRAWVADTFDPVQTIIRSDADLRGVNLRGAYLGGADLGGANLGGADLGGADLRGAHLDSANLGGAYLDSADLRGADLRYAYLGGADLRGANLRGADLRGAYLRYAYLGGADLRGADYTQATTWPAKFDAAAAGAVKL